MKSIQMPARYLSIVVTGISNGSARLACIVIEQAALYPKRYGGACHV